jgi:hypothetical protein
MKPSRWLKTMNWPDQEVMFLLRRFDTILPGAHELLDEKAPAPT